MLAPLKVSLLSSLKPILFALLVFFLLPATLCRAESCDPGGSIPVETVTSITPSTMYAGQTYNVVIMGNFPYDIPTYPGCNLNEDYVAQDLSGDGYPDVSVMADPNAPLYSLGTFSATEITLTITIGPDAPPGTAYLVLRGDGGDGTYVTIKIACPIPTITSVSPNVWFAGQRYVLAITGTGFVTPVSSAATGCPASTVKVSTPGRPPSLTVPVSGFSVVSATEIVARVAPNGVPSVANPTGVFYGAASATVQVTNSPPGQSRAVPRLAAALATPAAGSASAPADVVGATAIQWTSDPDGTSPIISGPGAELPNPTAVVGQKIVLTGNPTAGNFSRLPISLTIPSPPTWTVGGTNIGGYSPTTAEASVVETTLTGPTLTTYWVYPGTFPVTYESCVDGQTATPALYDCTTATATFEVSGVDSPSMNVVNELLANINTLTACHGLGAGPYLVYGNISGQAPLDPTQCALTGKPGIQFFPEGTASGNGNFLFAQIVNSDSVAESGASTSENCTGIPGVDGQYPYQGQINPPSVPDAPLWSLSSDFTTVTRNFSATMYLLWQSTATGTTSIPVPLGYTPWVFNATATNRGTVNAPVWTATGLGAPIKSDGNDTAFVLSIPTQPNFGFPTWSEPASPATCKSN